MKAVAAKDRGILDLRRTSALTTIKTSLLFLINSDSKF